MSDVDWQASEDILPPFWPPSTWLQNTNFSEVSQIVLKGRISAKYIFPLVLQHTLSDLCNPM